jgi:hypothetical protein
MRITSCIGHPLNLNVLKQDQERYGLGRMDIEPASPEQISRAVVQSVELPPVNVQYDDEGSRMSIPAQVVKLGGVSGTQLARKEDQVFITSLMTIIAAKKDGRVLDDLFFSFGDVRDENGKFIGTRGLGRPIFPREPQQANRPFEIPDSRSFSRLVNTCPYPAKLYDAQTPKKVGDTFPAAAELPIPDPSQQFVRTYQADLNKYWTERLRVPVYDTLVTGIQNYTPPEDGILRIVNAGILTALGSESLGGHAMLAHTVRSYEGSILGGRALAFLHPDSFDGWRA